VYSRVEAPASRAYHAACNPSYYADPANPERTHVTMHTRQRTQRGASAIALIIILAIIGAGTYIGLQYIPQYIEAGTVDSILSSIEQAHEEKPVSSANKVRDMINKQLDINQLDDLRDSFKVTQDEEIYIITVSYARELNLIYEKRPMKYEKTLILR
jgi:hypothetical protein